MTNRTDEIKEASLIYCSTSYRVVFRQGVLLADKIFKIFLINSIFLLNNKLYKNEKSKSTTNNRI